MTTSVIIKQEKGFEECGQVVENVPARQTQGYSRTKPKTTFSPVLKKKKKSEILEVLKIHLEMWFPSVMRIENG